MRFLGGLVVLLFAYLAFTGWRPYTAEERGQLPGDARRGPGGAIFWTGGFQGGK
ncbi:MULTISPECIES: hypothetical protein [Myxococcaceae]|jgi:hypothetical protein|uniref:hypothetical protein n=1 Tax=Myxococcaceae TaxID=31 RepID=UPI00188E5D6D|nr:MULTISPECIES: hypothetical protein [Myxococcaceae]MBF5045159.1 hypothetical protein [Simulacricoccus sp. 17bor-14]